MDSHLFLPLARNGMPPAQVSVHLSGVAWDIYPNPQFSMQCPGCGPLQSHCFCQKEAPKYVSVTQCNATAAGAVFKLQQFTVCLLRLA